MRRFNDLADFSREEIQDLIALASRLDRNPEPRALAGKVLSLLFLSPSLRTLSSFQAAMIRLGGGAFVISPEMSIHGLESRQGVVMDGDAAEHVREAIPVIASYGDAMGVRAFAGRRELARDIADSDFKGLTDLIDKPWINMESAIDHPCQSLADWKTMDELGIPANGGKFVLTWAYHPKALPLAVPSATLHMAAMRGMNVVHLRPPGFELPPAIVDKARRAAEKSGGSVTETTDRARGDARRPRRSTPSRIPRRASTATSSATRRCARSTSALGASTSRGSPTRVRTAGSCTACPCAAASSSRTGFSTARAAS